MTRHKIICQKCGVSIDVEQVNDSTAILIVCPNCEFKHQFIIATLQTLRSRYIENKQGREYDMRVKCGSDEQLITFRTYEDATTKLFAAKGDRLAIAFKDSGIDWIQNLSLKQQSFIGDTKSANATSIKVSANMEVRQKSFYTLLIGGLIILLFKYVVVGLGFPVWVKVVVILAGWTSIMAAVMNFFWSHEKDNDFVNGVVLLIAMAVATVLTALIINLPALISGM